MSQIRLFPHVLNRQCKALQRSWMRAARIRKVSEYNPGDLQLARSWFYPARQIKCRGRFSEYAMKLSSLPIFLIVYFTTLSQ
jgi:hypothetical protein